MIRKGDTTTFEHVQHASERTLKHDAQRKSLIAVVFDGELQLWVCTDVGAALKELEEYYRMDWAGTGRVLPVHVLSHSRYTTIACI